MAAWTWRKWVDPFVDFGQQMEISREVSLGSVPYRDVALLHGPLSAGFQALLFRLCQNPHQGVLAPHHLPVGASADFTE